MNTYTWKINSLECVKSENKPDVVIKLIWEVKTTNGRNTVSLNGICNVDLDKNEIFIDYDKLTELVVMSWLEESIGIDKMQEMQQEMDNQLIALDKVIIDVTTEVMPPPWSV